MRRRGKLLLSIAALTIGMVAILLIWNREPRYQGRTISEWADLGLKATDSVPWDEPNVILASNAIHQIGAESFPWLRSNYPRKSGFRARLMSLLQSISAARSVAASSSALRSERLSFSLYSLGESALPLVPELADVDYFYPGYFITDIGPRALPALIPMLTNSAPNADAILALVQVRRWGEKAAAAGPTLWLAVQVGQIPTNESSWLNALAATGYRREELAHLLLTRMQTPTRTPDENASDIFTLSLIPSAGPAALFSLLNHSSRQIQQGSMESLCHLWGRSVPPPDFAELPRFRVSRRVFGDDTPRSKVADESTRTALRAAPISTRLRAVELMSELYATWLDANPEHSFHPALEVLTTLAEDPDPQVSQAAANALAGFRLPKGR